MGSATGGGAGGPWPPQRTDWGGASNAFGPPPQFFGKIMLWNTINVQCFSLKHWKCMHVMHETVECMHRLLCIMHTICIDTSTNTVHTLYILYMHVHSYVMHLLCILQCSLVLQYTRIHKLTCMSCVANYTGNGQSTV